MNPDFPMPYNQTTDPVIQPMYDSALDGSPAQLASLPLGPQIWGILSGLHNYVNVTELVNVLGRDVMSGKTPGDIIADVIADANAIFPESTTRALAVMALQAAKFIADLHPTHPAPVAPIPTI
jgi:hypothetical protein